MGYQVLLTAGAEHDLETLYDHVARRDGQTRAERLLDRLLGTVESLAEYSDRGTVPAEVRALGIRDYRQVYFKPYRIIYRIDETRVLIYLIVDGRRDMQSVLARRLLRT